MVVIVVAAGKKLLRAARKGGPGRGHRGYGDMDIYHLGGLGVILDELHLVVV